MGAISCTKVENDIVIVDWASPVIESENEGEERGY
jgi:hypothetical protein